MPFVSFFLPSQAVIWRHPQWLSYRHFGLLLGHLKPSLLQLNNATSLVGVLQHLLTGHMFQPQHLPWADSSLSMSFSSGRGQNCNVQILCSECRVGNWKLPLISIPAPIHSVTSILLPSQDLLLAQVPFAAHPNHPSVTQVPTIADVGFNICPCKTSRGLCQPVPPARQGLCTWKAALPVSITNISPVWCHLQN